MPRLLQRCAKDYASAHGLRVETAEWMGSLYELVMPNPDLAQDDRMGLAT